jgi:hypothetical protein
MVGPGNHEANCDNGGTSDAANNISYTYTICLPGKALKTFVSPAINDSTLIRIFLKVKPTLLDTSTISVCPATFREGRVTFGIRGSTAWSTISSWTARPTSATASSLPMRLVDLRQNTLVLSESQLRFKTCIFYLRVCLSLPLINDVFQDDERPS